MEQKEKVFADGFMFKRREDAPEFVIGQLSVKVDEAVAFLSQNARNGWVNLDIKTGRSGKQYLELNTYEPKKDADNVKPSVSSMPQVSDEDDEDLPF